MNRRSILLGLLAAPAIIRTPGLLMPVRPVDWYERQVVMWSKPQLWAVIHTDTGPLPPQPVVFNSGPNGLSAQLGRLPRSGSILGWMIYDEQRNPLYAQSKGLRPTAAELIASLAPASPTLRS